VSTGAGPVELGHAVPADAGLHTTAIFKAAGRAIASVGITDGPSHTEVMLTPTGECVVIEIAARIGTGYIGHLIVEALGIDVWGACLDVALGRIPDLSPQADRYATVRFLTTNRSGRLISVAGLPEPGPETPIVRVRVPNGSQVGPAIDNTGRLGCFTVVGDNAVAVEQLAAELLQRVIIGIDERGAPGRVGASARES
jgi:biotin carboxylase